MMTNATLIQNLQNPALYDHPVDYFKVIETHISWVLLTGRFAYKIKKPYNFEFLDFSTLEKRKHFCEKELLLNKRLAGEIYMGVVGIHGDVKSPNLNGQGAVFEYAIKMHEFPQESLLTALLARDELTPELIDNLAIRLAVFHQQAQPTTDHYLGTPEQIQAPVQQNFDQIRALLTTEVDLKQLDHVEQWATQQYQKLYPIFQQRKAAGFIRECHGDVHLNNIIVLHKEPTIFDCIEFNEEFRWTDTMADLGFLAMDLDDHHCFSYARRCINEYFQHTGDYEGLKILPYYQSYRAVVRAKIALFRLNQPDLNESERQAIRAEYDSCMALTERYMTEIKPVLVMMQGVSGSGKSTFAKAMAEHTGAIQIRSDIERKRLNGLPADSQTYSAINAHIYSPEKTDETYQELARLAQIIISAGYTVIVDATFLKVAQRKIFSDLAAKLYVFYTILMCVSEKEAAEAIIEDRQAKNIDASEARLDILEMQLESIEFLSAEETLHTVLVNVANVLQEPSLFDTISKKIVPSLS